MAGPVPVQEDEKAVVGKQTYPVESKMSIRSLCSVSSFEPASIAEEL